MLAFQTKVAVIYPEKIQGLFVLLFGAASWLIFNFFVNNKCQYLERSSLPHFIAVSKVENQMACHVGRTSPT